MNIPKDALFARRTKQVRIRKAARVLYNSQVLHIHVLRVWLEVRKLPEMSGTKIIPQ